MQRDPRSRQPALLNPADLAAMFEVSELVGHFRLDRGLLDVPEGWQEFEHAGWHLVHHPTLPVIPIMTSGVRIGWILGYPVTAAGRLLQGDWLLDPANLSWLELERALYSMGGRFIAIFLLENAHRVYLDAGGSMGMVFCGDDRMVASNPYLIPETSNTPYRAELVEAIGVSRRFTFFPFGLSPRVCVERLAPNHYLDLDEWRPVRHWPTNELDDVAASSHLVSIIAETVTRNIGAVIEKGPVQMSLTAGHDSRLLMACSRQWLDHIAFVTAPHHARGGRIDVNVARHIANKMGLNHRVLPAKKALPRDLNRWFYRTGFMTGAPIARSEVLTYAQMDPGAPYLMGVYGDIGRALFWKKGDSVSSSITVEELLQRRGTPPLPEILERGQHWLNGLPTRNPLIVLDLYWLEQAWGGWGGFLAYGQVDAGSYHHYPFLHRQVIEAMLRLPPEYRLGHQLSWDIIGSTWPELLEFPFNQASAGVYGAYRRLRGFARRHLKERLLSVRHPPGLTGFE